MTTSDEERRRILKQRALVTPAEGAFLLHRSKRQVNRWVTSGVVPVEKIINGQRYVSRVELTRHVADPDRATRRPPSQRE